MFLFFSVGSIDFMVTLWKRWKGNVKMSGNRRALGLVFAAIILIVVAVAAVVGTELVTWTGVFSFLWTRNEGELILGTPIGWHGDGSTVNITASCAGKEAFTVIEVLVQNINCTFQWADSGSAGWLPSPAGPVAPGSSITLEIQYFVGWSSGYSYTFWIRTEKGNEYETTGTCPV